MAPESASLTRPAGGKCFLAFSPFENKVAQELGRSRYQGYKVLKVVQVVTKASLQNLMPSVKLFIEEWVEVGSMSNISQRQKEMLHRPSSATAGDVTVNLRKRREESRGTLPLP